MSAGFRRPMFRHVRTQKAQHHHVLRHPRAPQTAQHRHERRSPAFTACMNKTVARWGSRLVSYIKRRHESAGRQPLGVPSRDGDNCSGDAVPYAPDLSRWTSPKENPTHKCGGSGAIRRVSSHHCRLARSAPTRLLPTCWSPCSHRRPPLSRRPP